MTPELATLLKTPKTLKIVVNRAGRSLKTAIIDLNCFFHKILVNERCGEKHDVGTFGEKHSGSVIGSVICTEF